MSDVKNRVLICSPDINFLNKFRPQLENDFEVQMGSSEEIAAFLAKDWKPHVAIVDGDSFGNLTTQLRQACTYAQLGIMVVTAKEGIFKEEYAFRSGADHFLPQPQDYKSIVWRLVSLIRKMQGPSLPKTNQSQEKPKAPSTITFNNMTIYPQDYLVKVNGRVVKITPIQFKLLVAFITHSDQLLSRDWIQENIWEGAQISPRSIDAQISKMKKLLPEVGKSIINIYGQGYILTESPNQAA